ncbi:hypothetical protein [Candidatus Oleimmundimicrobium sp.]|uniref:hypothetical protein n=1 Tax=Candidatus Oleimmundimicrobium sp. TaxID=3060597 RepID=UPI002720A9A7|nr:hypothetical protein [Candidatus Oleimmundimicrobium sp.]MDO8885324.1 hypothetical protein [Candidatus Oleimmundimicrobium sp.]
MPESKFFEAVKKAFEEMSLNIMEERVINYVVKELHAGRNLSSILQDAYVKNRVDEERLTHILGDPEILRAIDDELKKAFLEQDFKFKE